MQFTTTRWIGNQWLAIDIMPVDEQYFLPILYQLVTHYGIAVPPVTDAITGYIAEFTLLGSTAIMSIDTYDFSIAFADEMVRDDALTYLQSLPPQFWEAQC